MVAGNSELRKQQLSKTFACSFGAGSDFYSARSKRDAENPRKQQPEIVWVFFCGRWKAELSSQHLLFLFLICPTGRGPNAQSCIQSRSRKVRPEQKITKASEKDAEKTYKNQHPPVYFDPKTHFCQPNPRKCVFCVCVCFLVNQLVIPDGFDQLSQLLLLTFVEKPICLERQAAPIPWI